MFCSVAMTANCAKRVITYEGGEPDVKHTHTATEPNCTSLECPQISDQDCLLPCVNGNVLSSSSHCLHAELLQASVNQR